MIKLYKKLYNKLDKKYVKLWLGSAFALLNSPTLLTLSSSINQRTFVVEENRSCVTVKWGKLSVKFLKVRPKIDDTVVGYISFPDDDSKNTIVLKTNFRQINSLGSFFTF